MDRDRRPAPWFSWISAICLLCFGFCLLGAPITGYYKSPLAKLTWYVMTTGVVLAPFAALFAAWLALKRGERNPEKTQGCFLLGLFACGLVVTGAVMALVGYIRGGS